MDNFRQEPHQIWLCFEENVLEPILFPLAAFILFAQLWELIMLPEPFATTFWKVLPVNITTFPTPYIAFLVIYILWMLGRRRQKRQEGKDRKDMVEALNQLSNTNNEIVKTMKMIQEKMDKEKTNDQTTKIQ